MPKDTRHLIDAQKQKIDKLFKDYRESLQHEKQHKEQHMLLNRTYMAVSWLSLSVILTTGLAMYRDDVIISAMIGSTISAIALTLTKFAV